MNRTHLITFVCSLLLVSCGIHFRVHNPKKPGKVPEFSREQVLLGELTPYRSCFDVYYYDLSVEVRHGSRSLSGVVEIHARAVRDFDTLQLDLHPNLAITELVDKATGQAVNYQREERAIWVQNSRKKGETFVLSVAYGGKPYVAKRPPWKGGFVWDNDSEGNPWDGVACESDGASLWWPLKDHTSDEPDSMRLHYTVPKGLTAVGNGQLEDKTENDKTTTFHWFVSYPINTYNVTIYVGDFQVLEDQYQGINGKELKITHYVLPENYETAKKHFRQLKGMLDVFEDRFGPYPWYRDGFKLVESPYAGMEHQTAIAYGNGYKNDLNGNTDYIILHETAHEWWGNSITAKDLADVWLQEGFATYAEALYLEDRDGQEGYIQHLLFNRIFIKNKYPVVGVEDRRWFHFRKNSDVYMKGSWILHTLRGQIDEDEVFFDIIKTFATQYQYQIVETADFIRLVNEKTGKDYGWFFDQYLSQNQAPELEYAVDDGKMYYRWANVNPEFDQLKLRLDLGRKKVLIRPSSKTKWIPVPNEEAVKMALKRETRVLFAIEENRALLKK